jgi:hypothetical protein
MRARNRSSRRAMSFGWAETWLAASLVISMLGCGGSTGPYFDTPGEGGATAGAAGTSTAPGDAGSAGHGGSSAGGTSGGSGGSAAGTGGVAVSSGGSGGGSAGLGGNGGSAGAVNRDAGRDATVDGSGGSTAGAGGGIQQDANAADSIAPVCAPLASSCEYSSECCSHYCKAETHKCTEPERCPRPCGPGTYCAPTFGQAPNTCEPTPTPQCQGTGTMARCNRCIVQNCPAEVVYCRCTNECFDRSSGCLPTCGPSFAGFTECADTLCKNECAR